MLLLPEYSESKGFILDSSVETCQPPWLDPRAISIEWRGERPWKEQLMSKWTSLETLPQGVMSCGCGGKQRDGIKLEGTGGHWQAPPPSSPRARVIPDKERAPPLLCKILSRQDFGLGSNGSDPHQRISMSVLSLWLQESFQGQQS